MAVHLIPSAVGAQEATPIADEPLDPGSFRGPVTDPSFHQGRDGVLEGIAFAGGEAPAG